MTKAMPSIRVLVVDDDRAICEYMETFLSENDRKQHVRHMLATLSHTSYQVGRLVGRLVGHGPRIAGPPAGVKRARATLDRTSGERQGPPTPRRPPSHPFGRCPRRSPGVSA